MRIITREEWETYGWDEKNALCDNARRCGVKNVNGKQPSYVDIIEGFNLPFTTEKHVIIIKHVIDNQKFTLGKPKNPKNFYEPDLVKIIIGGKEITVNEETE
jgi:hypothetical protein